MAYQYHPIDLGLIFGIAQNTRALEQQRQAQDFQRQQASQQMDLQRRDQDMQEQQFTAQQQVSQQAAQQAAAEKQRTAITSRLGFAARSMTGDPAQYAQIRQGLVANLPQIAQVMPEQVPDAGTLQQWALGDVSPEQFQAMQKDQAAQGRWAADRKMQGEQFADTQKLGWARLGDERAQREAASKLAAEKASIDRADKIDAATTGLRKEFVVHPVVKDMIQVRSGWQKIQDASANTPQGHMSLIFGFMKMQDPGSTVREGEYANAENTRGVSDYARAMYNKVVDGQKLTNEQVAGFRFEAEKLMGAQMKMYAPVADYYGKMATSRGIDFSPADVVGFDDRPSGKDSHQPTDIQSLSDADLAAERARLAGER